MKVYVPKWIPDQLLKCCIDVVEQFKNVPRKCFKGRVSGATVLLNKQTGSSPAVDVAK